MGTLYDWNVSADANTAVSGVNIAEGCPASNMNNAVRQIMADIRNTFAGDMFIGGTTASGYQLKISGNKTTNTLVALQNLEAVGYSGFHFINSGGALKAHLGWANGSAGTRPNSAYFGTTSGSGGTVQLTSEDTTAVLIDPSQNVHVAGGTVTGSGRLRVSAVGTFPHYAITTFDTVNYVAVQAVREVGGSPLERGRLDVTDTGMTLWSASDATEKLDDGEFTANQAWEVLRLIRIHNFRWECNNQPDVGPFAQELFKVYPRAVSVGGWRDENGAPAEARAPGAMYISWKVNRDALIPLVVVALQDIDARLTAGGL